MNSADTISGRPDEKILKTAYRFLSYRSRTVHEIKAYLNKKGFLIEEITDTVSYLLDHGYLDDRLYCKDYLEYHTRHKPRSKFAYKYDLRRKGINEAVIDKALSKYSDEQLAVAAIEKRRHQWDHSDIAVFKKKALAHLNYKGFDWHSSLSALQTITEGLNLDED